MQYDAVSETEELGLYKVQEEEEEEESAM